MSTTLVWYDAEEDQIGTNVFFDGFLFALQTDKIPRYCVLLGEL